MNFRGTKVSFVKKSTVGAYFHTEVFLWLDFFFSKMRRDPYTRNTG